MLQFDLENENETIRNYRTRIRQCEAIGEYALAEQIRQILVPGAGSPNRSCNCSWY
jgi:bacterioferritin